MGKQCSEDQFVRYILSLVNDTKWTSAGAVHTRVKSMKAQLVRMGGLMPTHRTTEIVQTLRRLEDMDTVTQAHPLTGREVGAMLRKLEQKGQLQAMALIAIVWLTAMRLGTALLLTTKGLSLDTDQPGLQCHRHKNVGTAHGQHPLMRAGPLVAVIRRWKATRKGKKMLFTWSRTTAMKTLQAVIGVHIGGHSFRRGVLQELQRRGVPTKDLLAMSGHKSEHQLFQYLGLVPRDQHDTMVRMQEMLTDSVTN